MTKNGPPSGTALVKDINWMGTWDESGSVSEPPCASARHGSFVPRNAGPSTGAAPRVVTPEVV